ncbi:uncharacterized protein LOC143234706 [Tachypleus tridentatus]|uniref:uncharacterized protein LOC143234706 n=1 Tax=Tachypleus tridentatus TaxID=6853 RepID=UPI003FD199FE
MTSSDDTYLKSKTVVAQDRIRSLSGGTSKMSTHREGLIPSRSRRPSGDDVLSGVSPSRKLAIFEAFRPRSKSDSKWQTPAILTTIKNSMQNTFSSSPGGGNSPTQALSQLQVSLGSSIASNSSDPFSRGEYRKQASGSESKSGPVSKVIERFRNRSNSIATDVFSKRFSSAGGGAPSGKACFVWT